jgi:hypothetical protein
VKSAPYDAVGDDATDDTAAFTAALRDAALAGGATVFVPPGHYRVSTTLEVPALVTLSGSGMGTTWLVHAGTSGPLLLARGLRFKVRDLSLVRPPAAPAAPPGLDGIQTQFDSTACGLVGQRCASEFELTNLELSGFYDNLSVSGSVNSIVSNVRSHNAQRHGVVGAGAVWGYWTTVVTEANKGHGLCFGPESAVVGADLCPTSADGAPVLRADHPPAACFTPFMSGVQTFANAGWGLYSTCQTFVGGTPSFFNNDSRGEIHLNVIYFVGATAVPLGDAGHIANADLQWAGQNPWATQLVPGFVNDFKAPAIHLGLESGPVRLSDLSILGSRGNGLWLQTGAAVHQVSGVRVLGSGSRTAAELLSDPPDPDHQFCVQSQTSGAMFNALVCENPSRIGGNHVSITASRFTAGQGLPTLHLTNGAFITLSGNLIYAPPPTLALEVDAGVTLTSAGNTIDGLQGP